MTHTRSHSSRTVAHTLTESQIKLSIFLSNVFKISLDLPLSLDASISYDEDVKPGKRDQRESHHIILHAYVRSESFD
jgi:hypothetical protein